MEIERTGEALPDQFRTDDAVGTVEYNGVTYYFCSEFCRDAFVADPAAYVP